MDDIQVKITQSKKTGYYSLTRLTKSKLILLHNTLNDYALKTQIRLALLDLMPGEERVKLQSEDAIESYFESEGLVLKSSKSASNSNGSNGSTTTPVNLPSGTGDVNGVVNSASFSAPAPAPQVQESSDEDAEEESLEEEEELAY